MSGIELAPADLADLVERTEGWPAGVYLAALLLRGHPSPGAFVQQFSGTSRFVVDFLAEEVLSRQPAVIRQFLARTSILGRFCAPLCDAVLGSGQSAEIIDVLERENLFVIPLDETRGWFRYHHLLAQVRSSELAHAEPGIVPALHRRASAWYLASGWVEEAIGHALAAGDVPGAVDLIARHWYAYVSAGRIGTVQMLAAFPDGVEALQGRLDGLGRQLGLPHVAASRGSALTGREVAVLQLLRGTLSLREIGLQLYVSPNTVKSRAQAIYRKLGVSTRHDAVARAHECGVL